MKIIPRWVQARARQLFWRTRKLRQRLTVARLVLLVEALVFGGAILIVLARHRTELLGNFTRHTEVLEFAAALVISGAAHILAKRRVVPALERRFSPAPYDDRRILFDLGLETRAAVNIDELFRSIVTRIGEALEAENVSIFVRDEVGDFVCRVSTMPEPPENSNPRDNGRAAPDLRFALERDAFIVKRLRHLAFPLSISPEDFAAWERAFTGASESVTRARQRERRVLQQLKSELLLQIMIKEQLVGILSLGPRRGRHQYSARDKEMLMSVAGQLAFLIENSKLVERMVAEEQLRRELALAAEVQLRLFPDQPPACLGLELVGYCQPAQAVGGDYYDFLALDNGRIGFAVADVAGKGISAALVMSNVQASLRSQAMAHNTIRREKNSLGAMMTAMNRLLCRSTGLATYVTFFYAQYDQQTRRLSYVNAGHNPPLLLSRAGANQSVHELSRADDLADLECAGEGQCELSMVGNGKTESVIEGGVALAETPQSLAQPDTSVALTLRRLTTGGPVIGLFDHCRYEQETVDMVPGDVLVAYTDGVTEALNLDEEEFGEARLQDALEKLAHLSAEEIQANLMRRLQDWCAGAPQHDDMTFVIVKAK